jgi:hypothetical protein
MNSDESIKVILRFYETVEKLIETRQIRGKQTFTSKYGINRRNFNFVEKNPHSNMFQIAWLGHLIRDYNVSSEWLMTGEGQMFNKNED